MPSMLMPMPRFDHRAATVTSAESLGQLVREFLAEGADLDELALIIVDEAALPAVTDAVGGPLDRVVVAPSQRVFPGSSAAMFSLYDDVIQQALALGHRSVRIVGQPVWWATQVAPDWCEFEEAVNSFFDGWPVTALCVIDDQVPAGERDQFFRAHPRLSRGEPNPAFAGCGAPS